MYSYKKNNKLVDIFSNISELYNYINKTPRRRTAGNSSESGDYDFTNTHSLDEAYDLLLGGDEKLFGKFKKLDKISVEKILGNVINRPKEINDVVGYQANVPQFLLGIPTSMINQEPKKTSQKVLNIALSVGVSACVDTDEIEEAGNIYIQVLDLLEKAGYRINLYIISANDTYNNGKIYSLVRVKTDKEPFNIKKSIFPIMHPSMLRRIFFKYWEVCDCFYEDGDRDFTQGGYGRVNDDKKNISEILNKTLKMNFIVWRFQRFNDNKVDVNAKTILDELKRDYGIDLGKEG